MIALLTTLIASLAKGQWRDVQSLGVGGEPYVSCDGAGNVYVSTHGIDGRIYSSADWGEHLRVLACLPDVDSDSCVIPMSENNIAFAYMRMGPPAGIWVWRGTGFHDFFAPMDQVEGPVDREWLAYDTVTDQLLIAYANAEINSNHPGGVQFGYADRTASAFTLEAPLGNERSFNPSLAASLTGRFRYVLWQNASSEESNREDRPVNDIAFSWQPRDGHFSKPQTLAELPPFTKPLNYNSERWVQCSIAAIRENGIAVAYAKYVKWTVDAKSTDCLLIHTRVSGDHGVSFSQEKTLLSSSEIDSAVRQLRRSSKGISWPYIQTQPWLCTDGVGHLHAVFLDNRHGYDDGTAYGDPSGTKYGHWQVRHTSCPTAFEDFAVSDAVSATWRGELPPLDFICSAADSRFAYVAWRESRGTTPRGGTAPSPLFFAREPVH